MKENLIKDLRNYLIAKKEHYNEEIDSIIYDYMDVDLGKNEFEEINNLRRQIRRIYLLIEKIDEFEKNEGE